MLAKHWYSEEGRVHSSEKKYKKENPCSKSLVFVLSLIPHAPLPSSPSFRFVSCIEIEPVLYFTLLFLHHTWVDL